MIIKAFNLGIAFGNQASFIPFNGTICIEFGFKNPFATNGLFVRGKRFKSPGGIGFKGTELIRHCFTPMGMAKGSGIARRFNRRGESM